MNTHHPILAALALALTACPAADEPTDEIFELTVIDDAALMPLDEDTIDDEEALAESMPAIEPTATGSAALQREAIPHHDPRFHDHYNEAVLYLEEGSDADAVDALRMALFDAPDSAPAWLLLGETYASLGRPRQSMDCVEEALVHDRDLPGAHAFAAGWHLKRGEPDQARPHAERLARLQPDDARATHLLARSYLGLEMWSEAITWSRRTISRDPQHIDAYNAVGFAALQVGRNELALQYLQAATELDGLRPHMLNNLGIAFERLDRPVDALQAFADAAAMDPAYTPAVVNRDRVRQVVDRQIADEVARILAEQAGERGLPTAEAGGQDDPDPTTVSP